MKTTVFFAFLGLAAATTVPSFLEDCPDSCPEIHAPVCGSNGKQLKEFGNECELRQFTCNHYKTDGVFKFLKDGDCTLPKIYGRLSVIPGFVPECPQVWEPVCGFDGTTYKTYPNECILNVLNDKKKNGFVSVGSGACEYRGRESHEEKEIEEDEDEDVSKDCPSCPDVDDPVLATDGTEEREFRNACEIESFNCYESRNFRLIGSKASEEIEWSSEKEKKEEVVKDCPGCLDIYASVWASDADGTGTEVREVANESSDFRARRSGPRDEKDLPKLKTEEDCPPCKDTYEPVCASDGDQLRTFRNECEVQSFNCFESTDFTTMKTGEC